MSHPERPSGGGQTATVTKPPSGGTLAEFATAHGLTQSAARPPFGVYLRSVWQRRNFIWSFASAKNISLYTDSRLGQVWQILTPLLNAAVYYLIFGLLLGTSRGLPDFIPFLVAGVFLFGFTQRSVQTGSKSVGDNLSLIRALHFPRATLPLAYAIVELQQLLISLVVLFIIVLSFGEPISWHMLVVVPIIAMQLMFNVGISMAMARMGAFNRDITQLLPFLLRTWMYFSGVIFALPSLVEKFKSHPWVIKLLELNPGYVYPELARRELLGRYRTYVHEPKHWINHHKTNIGGLGEGAGTHLWIYAVIWAVVLLVGGFWWFHRAEERYGRG
jgi:teichoic acid transport system permease protein